jgi:hypothetical protein
LARRNKFIQGAPKVLTVPYQSQVLDVQAKEGSEERVDVSIGASQAFEHYAALAQSLEEDEQLLHSALRQTRQRIMEGKKGLLFKHMCKDAGTQD